MAEEGAAPKKGGNKIAIIGISAMMLVTGGFFGLKMRGGGDKTDQDALTLGADIVPVHEFLVNLQDTTESGKYLRTEIAVQCATGDEGISKEDLDKFSAPLEDAIISVLRSHSVDEIKTVQGSQHLKKEIAKAANAALIEVHDAASPNKPYKIIEDKKKHPEWDSQTGPILKVYFTSFAFQ